MRIKTNLFYFSQNRNDKHNVQKEEISLDLKSIKKEEMNKVVDLILPTRNNQSVIRHFFEANKSYLSNMNNVKVQKQDIVYNDTDKVEIGSYKGKIWHKLSYPNIHIGLSNKLTFLPITEADIENYFNLDDKQNNDFSIKLKHKLLMDTLNNITEQKAFLPLDSKVRNNEVQNVRNRTFILSLYDCFLNNNIVNDKFDFILNPKYRTLSSVKNELTRGYEDITKNYMLDIYRKTIEDYLIVDGELWSLGPEPIIYYNLDKNSYQVKSSLNDYMIEIDKEIKFEKQLSDYVYTLNDFRNLEDEKKYFKNLNISVIDLSHLNLSNIDFSVNIFAYAFFKSFAKLFLKDIYASKETFLSEEEQYRLNRIAKFGKNIKENNTEQIINDLDYISSIPLFENLPIVQKKRVKEIKDLWKFRTIDMEDISSLKI